MSEGRSRHDELRRLAEVATPGPWEANDARIIGLLHPDEPESGAVLFKSAALLDETGQGERDAAYIAAVSPDVLLALLAECARADRLTRALEQAREYLQGGRSGYKQLAVDTIVAALSDPGGVEE